MSALPAKADIIGGTGALCAAEDVAAFSRRGLLLL
jgi:hypothetical protein